MHNEPEGQGHPASDVQALSPRRGSGTEEQRAGGEPVGDSVTQRVKAAAPGLAALLTAAEVAQQQRARAAKERGAPRWTDVFTTQFTEFSNRPR